MSSLSVPEGRFQRPFRHDDVEGDLEGREHHGGEEEAGDDRDPQRDAADPPHEAGDQEKARDVETEELGEDAERQGRNEDLHDAAELIARHERLAGGVAGEQRRGDAVDARRAHHHGKIEGKISRLRPSDAQAAPMRQLSQPSSSANASSMSETAMSTLRAATTGRASS